MRKKVVFLLAVVLVAAVALAGCGNSSVSKDAEDQLAQAKAALAEAQTQGVQVNDADVKKVAEAESKLKSDSVQALILATEAKADIRNDIQDAFNVAQQTYETAKSAANAAISSATQGADLSQANQSLQTAATKQAAAKTIQDWYNPTDGPIYWAQLATSQATQASVAAATTQATQAEAAAMQQRIIQGSTQMMNLMKNYISSVGGNPADYTMGITKISAQNPNWATGTANQKVAAPGSTPIRFLFEYENGNWVLRAAPSWTQGQFGAPSDLMP